MKKIILNYWPVILIFFVWFVFSSPYFLKNRAPYPATFQNSFFAPWNSYPQFAVPVKNNALSDVVDEIYPWKHFTIEELKKGKIPWWNPFSFSGNPHAADFQTAVFSPFNLLFFVLPFIDAWSLLILLQPLLAGIFMYMFLRELGILKTGSAIGSFAFMFCGFMVVWMPYGTLSMAIAFLPLGLYAVERYFEKRKFFALILLAISLAISFFSGHFQVSLYASGYIFFYILYKFYFTEERKKMLPVFGAFGLGIIIALIQILPSLQLYGLSVRSGLFDNSGGIPFYNLIRIIAPDFFGNPVTRNDWNGKYAEWASFIGIVPLFLALIPLFYDKKRGFYFFFLTGLASIVFAAASPLQDFLIRLKLPILSTSIPSRIIVLFSFSFAVLAGYGAGVLKNIFEKGKLKKIIWLSAFFCGFVILIWGLLLTKLVMTGEYSMIAARNMVLPTFFIFAVFAIILLRHKVKSRFLGRFFLLLLMVFVVFDGLRFAQKWVPFDEKKLIFPDLPVISEMQKKIGDGRVYGKFGSYVDTYYRLPSIEGYDPLYIQRYGEFLASAQTGKYTPAVKSLALLEKRAKYAPRVLDLLGVNMLFHVIGDTGKDWAYPVWQKDKDGKYLYSVIYHDDNFQLYANKSALPRAKLFFDYEIIKNDKDIIKRFYDQSFDFRNKLILEEDPGMGKSKEIAKNSVKIVDYDTDKIVVDVASLKDGLLFVSDNYYPNWKAEVDGKSVKIFRADYTFRAVKVPAGKSSVVFYYNYPGI